MPPAYTVRFRLTVRKTGRFSAGRHECLPYSVFATFPKQPDKHQFVNLLTSILKTKIPDI